MNEPFPPTSGSALTRRVDLSGRARVAGVIGWPIQHSRSPRLHGFWLARYRIDGAYVPLAVAPGMLEVAVRGLVAAGFCGCNVTMPHKEAAARLCDVLSASAEQTGVVNTLVFSNGEITGNATDGGGFIANLRAQGIAPDAGPALVLGAGGAACAIAFALRNLGVAVTITNRTPDRAGLLARRIPGLSVIPWEERGAVLGQQRLLVNATAAGMAGMPALDLDLTRAPSTLTVADIVTVPAETSLLRNARAHGLKAIGGLGMLAHQAVPGFAAWFGIKPEVDAAVLDLLVRAET